MPAHTRAGEWLDGLLGSTKAPTFVVGTTPPGADAPVSFLLKVRGPGWATRWGRGTDL